MTVFGENTLSFLQYPIWTQLSALYVRYYEKLRSCTYRSAASTELSLLGQSHFLRSVENCSHLLTCLSKSDNLPLREKSFGSIQSFDSSMRPFLIKISSFQFTVFASLLAVAACNPIGYGPAGYGSAGYGAAGYGAAGYGAAGYGAGSYGAAGYAGAGSSGYGGYESAGYEHEAPAKYEFGYGVSDPHTGDFKSQSEVADGHSVKVSCRKVLRKISAFFPPNVNSLHSACLLSGSVLSVGI